MATPAQGPSPDLLSRVQAVVGNNSAPGAKSPTVLPPEPPTAPSDLLSRVGQVAKTGQSPPAPKQQPSLLGTIGSDVAGMGKGMLEMAGMFAQPGMGVYDPNSPVAKMLAQQWDASVQAKNRMVDAAKKGDWLGVTQHAAGIIPVANNVDAAMTNYQANPSHENLAHVITASLPAFVPSMIRGAGLASDALKVGGSTAGEVAEEGTEAAEETPNPGLVKKIVKGKNVEQKPAQTALKEAAGTDEESLQETLAKPIADNQAKADSLYDEMDKTGVDVKNLTQKLRNTERKLTQLTDTPEDQTLESKLLNSREGLIQKIKDSGVSDDQIAEADTQFQKTKALSDIQSRIFKNPSVVEGDVAHGTPETVNVDSTIKALKKLETSKYGNRVEQAFGKDGANELFDKLYEAQRMGVHAMKVQQVAKWIGGVVGMGTILAGTEKALGAVKSNE